MLLSSLFTTLYGLLEVLIVLVPTLLSVAFMTIIERKVMGAMQRRVGPNKVGYYGILQPFSDALKLVVKETVIPAHSTVSLFFLAPIISLVFSLLGWAVIPFGSGLVISDFSLGILYSMAISSLGVYGILFAGWAANSKYAFIGSLRSTAQMISYELIFSSAILCIIYMTGSFNIIDIIETQQAIMFIIPLLPLFIIFFISALAETNRTPFDLPEAESELVAGFFTEHSGMIFVFFFLAEYGSIVLISTLNIILFFGGYNMPYLFINNSWLSLESYILGFKVCGILFLFVWIRASLPRLRYDQLMTFCWTGLLPVVIALVIIVPSLLIACDYQPV